MRWRRRGIIMLGTRDCGRKGIFGEGVQDFKGDLSGLPIEKETGVFDALETEGHKVAAAAAPVSAALVVVGDNGCSFLLFVCMGERRGGYLGWNGIG